MATRAGTPMVSMIVAAVCRASCSRALRTSARVRMSCHSRWSERGSMGLPLGWAKTNPELTQSVPAARRSAAWALRWVFRASMSGWGRAIVRRPAWDLGGDQDQAPRRSVRALCRPGSTAGRLAAVLVGLALEGLPDSEGALVQVDGVPGQAEGFSLAQAERERDGPAGGVAPAGRGLDDLPCLVLGERADLRPVHGGRVDKGAHVAGHTSAPQGDLQSAGQDAVGLQHGGGGEAAVEQLTPCSFDVFGLEPVEAVVSELGLDLVLGQAPVAGQGGGPAPSVLAISVR